VLVHRVPFYFKFSISFSKIFNSAFTGPEIAPLHVQTLCYIHDDFVYNPWRYYLLERSTLVIQHVYTFRLFFASKFSDNLPSVGEFVREQSPAFSEFGVE